MVAFGAPAEGGAVFGGGDEVGLEQVDLLAEGPQVGGVAAVGQGAGVVGVEQAGVIVQEPGQRAGAGVVFLGDAGAGAGFGDQFLVGGEQVPDGGFGQPELVEQVQFAGVVVAVVADVVLCV